MPSNIKIINLIDFLRKISVVKSIVYNLAILIFLLSLSSQSLSSTVQFSLVHNATNNIFQSYQPFSDQITSANLYFGGDSDSVALYGNLDLNYLYKYPGLSSFAGKLGADYLLPAGQKSAFYFALEGEAVLFRELYNYFNHGTVRFLTNFKSYLNASTILRIESQSQVKNYKYSIFDYFSENLTLSLDSYFSTRTTIKVETSYGYKYYFHPGVITVTEEPASSVESLSSTSTLGIGSSKSTPMSTFIASQGGGPGSGHGNPASNYEMGGSYSIRGIPYQTVYYPGGQNIQVFSVSGLIAQGIGDHLGLSLSGLKQWYLKGENPFASSDEFFMVENPTYDQFSWQGYSLRAKLTAELSQRLHSEFQYDYFSREFPGLTSLDLDGNSLAITRKDRRHQFSAKLQLDLSRISFFVNYSYLKNISNDPWFDWNGSFISAGLIWNLSLSQTK
jgi:hypothetical protein